VSEDSARAGQQLLPPEKMQLTGGILPPLPPVSVAVETVRKQRPNNRYRKKLQPVVVLPPVANDSRQYVTADNQRGVRHPAENRQHFVDLSNFPNSDGESKNSSAIESEEESEDSVSSCGGYSDGLPLGMSISVMGDGEMEKADTTAFINGSIALFRMREEESLMWEDYEDDCGFDDHEDDKAVKPVLCARLSAKALQQQQHVFCELEDEDGDHDERINMFLDSLKDCGQ